MKLKDEPMKGLLEHIGKQVGCTYLSELHQPCLLPLIRQAVSTLDPEDYSLREWNDAVRYITGREYSFVNRKEAALCLQNLRMERGGNLQHEKV